MMPSAASVGSFVVVDVTDPQFFPGKTLTTDYRAAPQDGGTWFFFPADWMDADDFGCIIRRHPGQWLPRRWGFYVLGFEFGRRG